MPAHLHVDPRASQAPASDVGRAYDLMADGYDDVASEAFYLNQYDAYDRFLAHHFAKLRGRLLDLGCGTGIQTVVASKHADEVLGVDVAQHLVLTAQRKLPSGIFLGADACQLPFRDSSFDTLISFGEVISHIPDYRATFREAARVLRPNGFFLFSVLNKWNLRTITRPIELFAALRGRPGHWRRWGCEINDAGDFVSIDLKTFAPSELKDLTAAVGLKIRGVWAIHVASLLIPLRLQYGRMNAWGKLFATLGRLDRLVSRAPLVRSFGYTKMLVAEKSDHRG
jgi:SAM-dependent methyltransferase